MAKAYLAGRQIAFREINIEQDPAAAMYIMHKTGQAGVPVIEIGQKVILGFDRQAIDRALDEFKLV